MHTCGAQAGAVDGVAFCVVAAPAGLRATLAVPQQGTRPCALCAFPSTLAVARAVTRVTPAGIQARLGKWQTIT